MAVAHDQVPAGSPRQQGGISKAIKQIPGLAPNSSPSKENENGNKRESSSFSSPLSVAPQALRTRPSAGYAACPPRSQAYP